ncbi:hypothetical protein B0H13DRAFT_2348753 [Mycena leptocephala]|nr:hypothetical protein B0H13DRAFT_2348753 [Mycena leptocephala]
MDPLAGIPVEYKQDLASKGRYRIDREESDMHAGSMSRVQSRKSRVEDAEGNWTGGDEMLTRYDGETGLMEGPQGLFLEECDTIQGIQFMHDTSTSTFASFANALLTSMSPNLNQWMIDCLCGN